MEKNQRLISTDETKGRSSAQEIDQVLSEISRLYLERFKTLRYGDPLDVKIIGDKISALKAKLKKL